MKTNRIAIDFILKFFAMAIQAGKESWWRKVGRKGGPYITLSHLSLTLSVRPRCWRGQYQRCNRWGRPRHSATAMSAFLLHRHIGTVKFVQIPCFYHSFCHSALFDTESIWLETSTMWRYDILCLRISRAYLSLRTPQFSKPGMREWEGEGRVSSRFETSLLAWLTVWLLSYPSTWSTSPFSPLKWSKSNKRGPKMLC